MNISDMQKENDYWNRELRKLIPDDDYKKVMHCHFCELEGDFLCFSAIYGNLSEIIPKDKVVVDLGCNAGLQGYFFKDHKRYIGIDDTPMKSKYPIPEHDYIWYIRNGEPVPPYFSSENHHVLRAGSPNSTHICSTVQDYLNGLNMEQKNWLNEKCFAIMSYVPSREAFDMAEKAFSNFAWYYPYDVDKTGKADYYYDGNKIRLNGLTYDFQPYDRIKMAELKSEIKAVISREEEMER